MTTRQRFEAWFRAPPREGQTVLLPDDHPMWPGQYASYVTQLAWEAWEEAARAVGAKTAKEAGDVASGD